MIVCLCKGISSGTIVDEARRGCRTVAEIAHACDAGTECGACVRQIRELLDANTLQRRERNPPGAASR